MVRECIQHTVDSNGNAFAEDIAICALEGGDFAQLVEQQVVSRHSFLWNCLDNLELELVGLCNSLEC
jgi:hypothetical protein